MELGWLLPRARCQFRLRGQAQIWPAAPASTEHHHHRQALTPGGRALWGWPAPGEPFNKAEAFPAELPPETQVPANFVLLRIALQQVELLDLNAHPQTVAAGGLVMAKAGKKPSSSPDGLAEPMVAPNRWMAPAQGTPGPNQSGQSLLLRHFFQLHDSGGHELVP